MKKKIILILTVIVTIFITACTNNNIMENKKPKYEPFLSYEQAINKADSILNQLTVDEKIEMLVVIISFSQKVLRDLIFLTYI